MSNSKWRKRAAKITLLIMTASIIGCGGTSDTQQTAGSNSVTSPGGAGTLQRQILGTVHLERRVTQGSVTLTTANGQTTTPLTDLGTFLFPAKPIALPASLRVDTTIDGQPATLEAELSPDSPATLSIQLNVISTMVAQYHRKHPELSLSQAEQKVIQSLGLTGLPHYTMGLSHPHAGFSQAKFLQVARTSGGFNSLMNNVVNAVDNPAPRAKLVNGAFELDPGALALGLAQKLGNFTADKSLGWVLASLGLTNGDTQAINSALDQISAQLTEIQNTLNDLLRQVTALAANVLVTSINAPLAEIPDLNRQYRLAVGGTYSDAQVDDLISRILTHTTWVTLIDGAQRGSNGNTGLQDLTAQTLSNRLVTNDDQEALQAQADYYQNYQLVATNMLVEACHATSPVRAFDAEGLLDQYFISEKLQNSRLKLTTLVTPSAIFPPPKAPFSDVPTILPFPPPSSLDQLFPKLFTPRLSPYPTMPDGLLLDFQANQMWEFASHGPLSLSQARALAASYQLDGYRWHIPNRDEVRAMRENLTPTQYSQFAVDSTNSTPNYGGNVWTSSSEVYDASRGSYVRSVILYRFATDEYSSAGPIFTGPYSDGVEEPTDRAGNPIVLPTMLVADVDPATYKPTISMSITARDHSIDCQALLSYTIKDANGNPVTKTLDATSQAVWNITINGTNDTSNLKAHIGNGPEDSGTLVFRRNINPSDQIQVTAQLGNLSTSSNVVTLTPDLTPTGILISPNHLRTDGSYPYSQRLAFTLVTADGFYQNNQSTSRITFTTDDPTVTVSAGGSVNVTQPPTVEKAVTVTGTYNDGINPPVSGVCTLKLGLP